VLRTTRVGGNGVAPSDTEVPYISQCAAPLVSGVRLRPHCEQVLQPRDVRQPLWPRATRRLVCQPLQQLRIVEKRAPFICDDRLCQRLAAEAALRPAPMPLLCGVDLYKSRGVQKSGRDIADSARRQVSCVIKRAWHCVVRPHGRECMCALSKCRSMQCKSPCCISEMHILAPQ
jgi:hypothetical protein